MKAVKQHVHIGAGALGLGLICWLTHRAGLRVVVANRKTGSSAESLARHYHLKDTLIYNLVYQNGLTETVNLAGFIFYDEDADAFCDAIYDSNTLLITLSLRELRALDTVIPVLCRCLMKRARAGRPPVYIMACENSITSADLRNRLQEHDSAFTDYLNLFVFPECVVDRICTTPTLTDTLDMLTVRVERFANWIVAREPSLMFNLIDVLHPVMKECVSFVDDINIYKRRKLWIVNGPHLLIAIYLYYLVPDEEMEINPDYKHLPFLFENVYGATDALDEILQEAGEMFRSLYGSGCLPASFLKHVKARFTNEADTLDRVLKDFKEPRNDDYKALEVMLEKIYDRSTSLRMESNGYVSSMMTTKVIDMFIEMIHDENYFVRREALPDSETNGS